MTTGVFVSGANGYLAEWVIIQLLEKGYKVVGSVRTTEKGEKLKKQLANKNFEYEIVDEIAKPGAFDNALKKHPEVTVFIHNASPANLDSSDPLNEVMIPAVDGTKNAFAAIKAHGPQIKKVVFTSSIAAVVTPDFFGSPDQFANEDTWCPITWEEAPKDPLTGYFGSKTYAERAAWDFVKNEKPNFTLNSVLPTAVIGPEAFDLEGRTSLKSTADRLNIIINAGTDLSKVPYLSMPYIDVRDIAKAHIHAFESDVTNFRYLLSAGLYSNYDVLDVLNAKVPELKGKVAISPPGAGEKARAAQGKMDNSRTKKALGFEYISFEQSVIDGAKQILADK